MTKPLILFDIDGTLADITHRRHHVEGKHTRQDWKTFFAEMGDDTVNEPVADLYRTLLEAGRHELVIISGRPDNFRKLTEQWLVWNGIEFDRLLMRQADDTRPDTEIKKDILDLLRTEGRDIAFAVDDRDCVVDMWRENGITCLQCNYGDF